MPTHSKRLAGFYFHPPSVTVTCLLSSMMKGHGGWDRPTCSTRQGCAAFLGPIPSAVWSHHLETDPIKCRVCLFHRLPWWTVDCQIAAVSVLPVDVEPELHKIHRSFNLCAAAVPLFPSTLHDTRDAPFEFAQPASVPNTVNITTPTVLS